MQSTSTERQMVPRWAMALIADAQIPNGKYIRHILKAETISEMIDKVVEYFVKAAVAKICIRLYTEGKWRPEIAGMKENIDAKGLRD